NENNDVGEENYSGLEDGDDDDDDSQSFDENYYGYNQQPRTMMNRRMDHYSHSNRYINMNDRQNTILTTSDYDEPAHPIASTLIQISTSLQCYGCAFCNDPFDSSNVPILTFPNNENYSCTIEHTIYGSHRDVTQSCNLTDTNQFCCHTDLCNDSNTLRAMSFIYFIVVLIIITNAFKIK
ncbi:unnamed protein product, partial [Adineta steineri]